MDERIAVQITKKCLRALTETMDCSYQDDMASYVYAQHYTTNRWPSNRFYSIILGCGSTTETSRRQVYHMNGGQLSNSTKIFRTVLRYMIF